MFSTKPFHMGHLLIIKVPPTLAHQAPTTHTPKIKEEEICLETMSH